MTKIQFCENNFSYGTEEIVNKLRDEDFDVEVESCLGYCGDCAVGPFALVDDELIQADTADELYEMIKEEI
ncbi:DUF1450 domain-containing protein [Tissierella sp.]|uniref:DUF1450 domain-containing protein n=1 Tax=Tissierella sp. TaxID=41274 RepID=UPI0028579B39|nr:DUF1450 domain-containing protein [Tissierella sp.]MDR7855073.1 DUF1450 domain-containing protein [Tissierella sp.]